MKSNMQLIEMICKMQPIEFAGLARLLGVQILEPNPNLESEEDKKYQPRSFADVLADVLAAFEKLNRTRRREIIKLVKQSNLAKRGDKNASTTTNS